MTEDPALLESRDIQTLALLRRVRQVEDQGCSDIQKTFDGGVVFITGGTGFLGKQLVEKLLRSCRGIKKIILLTRSKKGKSKEERFKVVLEDPVFDEIRKIEPDFEKRICLVDGDITQLRVGLKDEDWNMLTEEVNFIFHEAATVRFNEPLKVAVITNVRGTREMIKLAEATKNLRAFVHVSTAYANCYIQSTSEKFYPAPAPAEALIEMVESLEESRIDEIAPGLIKCWPNTYTYSKAVTESLVKTMAEGKIPLCVVRPAIVLPAYCEPAPGWLDMSNCRGPSGLVLGSAIGLLKCLYVNEDTKLDLVPVDYVNNLTIAACWDTVKRWESGQNDIKIYTLSAYRKQYSWKYLREMGEPAGRTYIAPQTIWNQGLIQTSSKHLFMLYSIFFHFIPAFFVDLGLKAVGHKLRLSRVFNNAYKLNLVVGFFLVRNFLFNDDNTVELINKLSDEDKIIFSFDMPKIELINYLYSWWFGLRKYILKDGLQGTEKARQRVPYMRVLHYVVIILYAWALWKVLCFAFSLLGFMLSFVGLTCRSISS